MKKIFSIYRSSAGSGKTRTLAKEYLKTALTNQPGYFKHILAVTFTNKATSEMKERILHYLDIYSRGEFDSLAAELMAELNLKPQYFQKRCKEIQGEVLHGYSNFAISTIDTFFQKAIRAFTRESGLAGDYKLELDSDAVLETVIDSLVEEVGDKEEITKWVVEFAKDNLENERSWDVRKSLKSFAREIFKEDFKFIEEDLIDKTSEEGFIRALQAVLQQRKYNYINSISKKAKEALNYIHSQGWNRADFKYNYGGVYNFFSKMSETHSVKLTANKNIGSQPRNEYQKPENWANSKSVSKELIYQAADDILIRNLNDILNYRDKNYIEALSAEVALSNFFAFGLIADITRKLREYKTENNVMLIADAPKFLQGIIRDSDTPFIYEKVGSFYNHYFIDEFQDTSAMQWSNFMPLLQNGLDQGFRSLVVGDVKQSIYRWRGGDLTLLQNQVERQLGHERVEVKELTTNYRSGSNIVNFNNLVFGNIIGHQQQEGESLLKGSYQDVAQKSAKDFDGVVRVSFLTSASEDSSWKEESLQRLVSTLEELQDNGVPLRDIAILIRKNSEGQQVANYLMAKQASLTGKYRYDVISNESLRIDGATTIQVLISALEYLQNGYNSLSRVQLIKSYYSVISKPITNSDLLAISVKESFENLLPKRFLEESPTLLKLPLFELVETLIDIFSLNDITGELVYLLTFQSLVQDFSSKESSNLSAFLEWFEGKRDSISVQTSGDIDAIQIISIHKSKGLQFPYVILPFCAWELDHPAQLAPNLWLKPQIEDVEIFPYLPIKYSSALKDTLFSDGYENENIRIYLDNINLLYVALTRAERGMFINCPAAGVSRGKGISDLLLHAISMDENLLPYWQQGTGVFNHGNITRPLHSNGYLADGSTLLLDTYPSVSWRDRLHLKPTEGNTYLENGQEIETKRLRGVVHHDLLAQVYTMNDFLGGGVKRFVNGGLISEDGLNEFYTAFKACIASNKIEYWYDGSFEVKNEVPVVLPSGSQIRIDRLMINGDKVIVLDYKTGERKDQDINQVTYYLSVLRKMGYKDVSGYLLYLETDDLIEVR